jgi:hypothetical protein
MAREDLTFFYYNERVNDSGGVRGNVKVPAAFFEVCPKWAAAISEAKTVKELAGFNGNDHPNDFGGNIQNYNTCIVGEAYHNYFAEEYCSVQAKAGQRCNECEAFSNRFGNILRGETDHRGNRKQQLTQNIQDFTAHWRDTHNPLLHLDIETEEQLPVVP